MTTAIIAGATAALLLALVLAVLHLTGHLAYTDEDDERFW